MKNNDDLLTILDEKAFSDAPLREVIKHLYFQVIQSQVIEMELKTELAKANKKLKAIEDALSSQVFIRSGFLALRYNERTSEISVSNLYHIDFSNTIENDLLKIMFYKKSGKPRPTKWQTSEVAASFKMKGFTSLSEPRDVYKVAHRIKKRLQEEIKADVLYVKGKEIFWFHTN